MKTFLSAFSIFCAPLFFTKTKGECPTEVSNDRYTITRCDGSYKSGKNIYVNFIPMNQPCACTLTASFSGILLVIAELNGYYECRNEVAVSLDTATSVFHCKGTYPSAIHYNVVNNVTVVNVKATYTKNYSSGEFPLCLKINQNGGLGGIVSVQCGISTTDITISSATASTSNPETNSTTISTFLSSMPSSEVLSRMTTKTDHDSENNTNSSISTRILTPNRKGTFTSDANNLALQITLECFVVISVILAILSVYLYIQLKFRIPSVNEKGNSSSIETQRTRSGTTTDNYTELGLENVTAEPENQYESLARQENYTNLNTA